METQKLTYSVKEAAESMGVSENFLRYEIRLGHLPVKRFGRRTLINAADFDKYLDNGSKGNKQITTWTVPAGAEIGLKDLMVTTLEPVKVKGKLPYPVN